MADVGTKSPDTDLGGTGLFQPTMVAGRPVLQPQYLDSSTFMGSTTFSNAAAVDVTVTPGVYEFEFFDNANQISGTPENCYVKPGATATVAAKYLRATSAIRVIQMTIPPSQTAVSFLGLSANTTLVRWAKIVQGQK